MMPEERIDKIKAIDLALTQIEKQFGKGSIMRLGTKDALVPVEVIPPARCPLMRRWEWVGCRGEG